jgi:hypothetical protein
MLKYAPWLTREALVRRAVLLIFLLAACKDEPPLPPDCMGPDFDVTIMALDAPLPGDTVVHVAYGGGIVEDHRVDDPRAKHQNVFCYPADREGNLPGAGGEGGVRQISGPGGEGGSGGAGPEALRCRLWTDGPATVTVMTSIYPSVETRLRAKKGICTVMANIELGTDDGGT